MTNVTRIYAAPQGIAMPGDQQGFHRVRLQPRRRFVSLPVVKQVLSTAR